MRFDTDLIEPLEGQVSRGSHSTVDPDSLTAQQEGEDFMKFMSQMTGGG
jgi:hypothetical protein